MDEVVVIDDFCYCRLLFLEAGGGAAFLWVSHYSAELSWAGLAGWQARRRVEVLRAAG